MKWFSPKRIYLDYASATPVRKSVRKAMEKYWSKEFYNPSAIYEEGIGIKNDLENFRASVARIVGAGQNEIIFTSGGTESDNLAILGSLEEYKNSHPKLRPHIIISSIEHPAVVKAAEEVVRRGGEMSVIPVDGEGIVNPEKVRLALRPNTFIVSINYANGEIGTIEPIARIGRIIKEYRKRMESGYPLLHTDASAAAGLLPLELEKLQCDMLTLDSSKIYGPKGVGILAVRRGVRLRPQIVGGGQEKGLRAGTPSIPLIAGFAAALESADSMRESEFQRLAKLKKIFLDSVLKKIPQAALNGSSDSSLPNIASISILGILSEFLVLKLEKDGILVSVGTACSLDERISGSPTIRAIGKPELAESTLRISFGLDTNESDVNKASELLWKNVENLLK